MNILREIRRTKVDQTYRSDKYLNLHRRPKEAFIPGSGRKQETETSYKEILQTRNRKPRSGNALREARAK